MEAQEIGDEPWSQFRAGRAHRFTQAEYTICASRVC